MKKHTFESLIGLSVILFAGIASWFFFQRSNFSEKMGEVTVQAYFQSVAGISRGSDIKLAGVKVGYVKNLKLDPESLQAILTLSFSQEYPIPEDSVFAIKSDGLMGGKFVSILAGTSNSSISEGMKVFNNQSTMDLEGVIGQAVFGGKEKQ
jgi:phospholipid/cholesterol/gamma-HCH transport system substrate-binding protein